MPFSETWSLLREEEAVGRTAAERDRERAARSRARRLPDPDLISLPSHPLHTARRPASTATATLPSAAAVAAAPSITPLAANLTPTARRALALWLGGCAAWTATMVAFGGATRLTRSGLSMTDWKFTGESPPRTLEDWEVEFGKYKASPEYKRVNR